MFIYQFASSSSFNPTLHPNSSCPCSFHLLCQGSNKDGLEHTKHEIHANPSTFFLLRFKFLGLPGPQSRNYSPGRGEKRWFIQTKGPFSTPVRLPSLTQDSALHQYCGITIVLVLVSIHPQVGGRSPHAWGFPLFIAMVMADLKGVGINSSKLTIGWTELSGGADQLLSHSSQKKITY